MTKLAAAIAASLLAASAAAQGTPAPATTPPPPAPPAAAPAPAPQAIPAPPAVTPPPPPAAVPPPPTAAPPPQAWPPPPPPPAYQPPPGYQPPPPPPPAWPPPAPWTRPPYQRDSWYISFGVGTGGGSFTASDNTRHAFTSVVPGDATTAVLNFQVGATMTPRLLLGFDLTVLSTSGRSRGDCGGYGYGCDTTDSSIGIVSAAAVVTWFPMERGLFLRGGAGLASIEQDVYDGVSHVRASRNGLGLVAGAGWAWWLGRSFNLTLGVDLLAQGYGKAEGEPRGASAGALLLGFAWY